MHRKKFFLSKLNFCWNVHLFEHSLIVHLFEQSDIDIDIYIYNLKKLKVSIMVEDSGIEPLTSWMQIRRSPSWANPPRKLVGRGRLERPTSPLSGVRSNHLSYRPLKWFLHVRDTLKKRNEDGHIKIYFLTKRNFWSSLERRWSSRRFPYGYLVTTSPQSLIVP